MLLTDQKKYRLFKQADYLAQALDDRPHFYELRSRRCSIYRHNDTHLQCLVTGKNRIGQFKKLPYLTLHQDASPIEATFIFENHHLETVAKTLGIYRRRTLSEKQKIKLKELGKRTRFTALEARQKPYF